jgi:hypothetical protein
MAQQIKSACLRRGEIRELLDMVDAFNVGADAAELRAMARKFVNAAHSAERKALRSRGVDQLTGVILLAEMKAETR